MNLKAIIKHAMDEESRFSLAVFLRSGFITYFFVVGLFFSIQYISIYFIQDYDHWFEYEYVEPTKEEYAIGEDLWFVSQAEFYRDINVKWNDKLFCVPEEGGERQFTAGYISGAYQAKGKKDPSPWRYAVRPPNYETTCHLETDIIVTPLGDEKVQELTSKDFKIVKN